MSSLQSRWLSAAAVGAITGAVFAPALSNGLLQWDDAGYILENPGIRSLSLETLRWAFVEYPCNFWAPLTWLSLALDYSVWGLDPFGYHLTNLLLHAVNAGMLVLLAGELLAWRREGQPPGPAAEGQERWGALLAALLFALHPLRVESVAWAAERKDVLSLFFGIPAMLAWLRHAMAVRSDPAGRRHSSPGYWAALVFFCLSLLAKPMLVTLPIILLVLDWHPLGRVARGWRWVLVLEKVPFLIASLAVTALAMDAGRPARMSFNDSGPGSRLLNAADAIASYLGLTAWPVDISPFYLHPGNITAIAPRYVGAGALLLLITWLCLRFARERPWGLAAWIAFLVALLPILGFTQVGPQAMAARFTYFPSLFLSIPAAGGMVSAVMAQRRIAARRATSAAAALLLAFYAAVTVRHLSFWKDDVTLWTRVIDLKPHHSGRAYAQRASALQLGGRDREALADAEEALGIAVRKGYREVHVNHAQVARLRAAIGDVAGAAQAFERAIETSPPAAGELYRLERAYLFDASVRR